MSLQSITDRKTNCRKLRDKFAIADYRTLLVHSFFAAKQGVTNIHIIPLRILEGEKILFLAPEVPNKSIGLRLEEAKNIQASVTLISFIDDSKIFGKIKTREAKKIGEKIYHLFQFRPDHTAISSQLRQVYNRESFSLSLTKWGIS